MTRLARVLGLVAALAVSVPGCTSRLVEWPWRALPPVQLTEYPAARVYVYANAERCQVLVVTDTVVVQTAWTRCRWVVPTTPAPRRP